MSAPIATSSAVITAAKAAVTRALSGSRAGHVIEVVTEAVSRTAYGLQRGAAEGPVDLVADVGGRRR